MIQTQENSHKKTPNRLYASLQKSLLAFVDRHEGVFESLTRPATPFGGNWLPANRRALNAEATQEHLLSLQQQVDELSKQIARLSAQNSAATAQSAAQKNEIGLNRFRALHANS